MVELAIGYRLLAFGRSGEESWVEGDGSNFLNFLNFLNF
jgi:hypothetical protein